MRWLQFGCFTPLMHAHARMPQEPWRYGDRVLDLYRGYVLLHEQLVPYISAAALTAARTGVPIMRPLCLTDPADPRGWSITDAYGYGPALWVAPVLEEGAREREVPLPRGEWIETWSGQTVRGGGDVVVPAPIERDPGVGASRARSWSPIPPTTSRTVWARAGGPSQNDRSRRRCGASRRSATPPRGWPTGAGSAGGRALGAPRRSRRSPSVERWSGVGVLSSPRALR